MNKEKAEQKEKVVKETKEVKAKGPGVIETILSVITKNGPISKMDILTKLSAVFPDRDSEKMGRTIKVQLVGKDGNRRIEKEKGVSLSCDEKGLFSIAKKK